MKLLFTKKRLLIAGFFCLLIFLAYWPNRWNYIIIHHSAGDYGNIKTLQKIRKERQPIEPFEVIAYHYIIGNGNGMKDGEIASDNREKYNLWGVHVSESNWNINFTGLGICLIGNLDKKQITPKQYKSLLKKTSDLMEQYNIEIDNVLFHGKIKGESTKCPGKYFPYSKFKKDLSKNISL